MDNYFMEGDSITINRWMYSGYELNDEIFELFKKVSTINFDYYSKEIKRKLPNNVKKISFECMVNYDLCAILPDYLEELEIFNHANFPTNNLPKTLKSISFGSYYNQELDSLPDSIEEIYFQAIPEPYLCFNKPINNLPKKLKKLQLSYDFNQPIDNLPQSLEVLSLKYEFSQPLDFLPNNLKVLCIESKFNNRLDNLPKNLKMLILISLMYNHNLKSLPENLNILMINIFNYAKEYQFPQSLNTLIYFSNYSDKHPIIRLPPNLKTLILKEYDNELVLPESLEILGIGFDDYFYNIFDNSLELRRYCDTTKLPILPNKLPKNIKKLFIPVNIQWYTIDDDLITHNNKDKIFQYCKDNLYLKIDYSETICLNL